MATVRLADVIEPEIWEDYQSINSPEKTDVYQSGIIATSPLLDAAANLGGRKVHIPFWKDLNADDEENVSSDDPAVLATPKKISAGEMIAAVHHLNQTWSAMDLASELAGSNAMDRIQDRVDEYFTKRWQIRLIAILEGIRTDNGFSDNGDMQFDAAIEDGDNATAANLFSRSNFSAAAFTMGENYDTASLMLVHPVVYKTIFDADDIEFIPDSVGNLTIPTYQQLRVVQSKRMKTIAGLTSGFKYVTVIAGTGAFGEGNGMPNMPVETDREALAGNGAGQDILVVRKQYVLHPFGFSYTGISQANLSPTVSELELDSNWIRVVDDRESVNISFLLTNG